MPRYPNRTPFILTLALLVLVLLAPTHAMALPQGHAIRAVAEHPQAAPGLLSQLWSFLSTMWGENGSSPVPTGASASSEPGTDTGSILDPDGRP